MTFSKEKEKEAIKSVQATDLPIEQLITLLKGYYAKQPEIALLLDESKTISLAEAFVDLELVEHCKKEEQGEKGEKEEAFHGQGDDEKAFEQRRELLGQNTIQRKAITPDALFQSSEQGKPIARIYLSGAAGTGKTTLCKHLAYRFAIGDLWQNEADIVIYLPLREVVLYFPEEGKARESYRLKDIILGQWGDCAMFHQRGNLGSHIIKKIHKVALWELMQQNPQRVVFLLDGLDEVSLDHPAIHTLVNYLPRYILTSRPHGIPPAVDRYVENVGFSEENRTRYIHKYFALTEQPEEQAHALLDWLKHNPHLLGLSSIAVNCQLLCAAWQYYAKQELFYPAQLTLTQLYDNLMLQWQRRALQRELAIKNKLSELNHYSDQDIAEHYHQAIQILGELCFQALRQSSGVIVLGQWLEVGVKSTLVEAGETITIESKHQLLEQVLSLGVLKSQGLSKNPYKDKYEAAHLTFVEYLAANFLVHGFDEPEKTEARELSRQALLEYQYHAKFALVWRFVAGRLAARDKGGLRIFLLALLVGPQDLYGPQQLVLWLHCLEQVYPQLEQENVENPIISNSFLLLASWIEGKDPEYLKWLFTALRQCPRFCQHSKMQVLLGQVCENLIDVGTMEDTEDTEDDEELEDLSMLSPNRMAVIPSTPTVKLSVISIIQSILQLLSNEQQAQCLKILLARLQDSFNTQTKALIVLKAIIPYLHAEQKKQCFKSILLPFQHEDLFDINWEKTLETLEVSIPHLDIEQRKECFELIWPWLRSKLDSENHKKILKVLTACIPHFHAGQEKQCFRSLPLLSKEQQAQCVEFTLIQFQIKEWWIYDNAREDLRAFFPYLDEELQAQSLKYVLSLVQTGKRGVCTEGLKALQAFIPHLNTKQQLECFKFVATILAQNEDRYVRDHTLMTLRVFFPYLGADQWELCFKLILSILLQNKREAWELRDQEEHEGKILKILQECLPHFSADKRKQCFESILLLLQEERITRSEALRTLEACASDPDTILQKRYLETILALLQDKEFWVRKQALECLEVLLPHIDVEQRALCFKSIIALQDQDWYWGKDIVLKQAHKTLRKFIPHLDVEQQIFSLKCIFSRRYDEKELCECIQTLQVFFPYLDIEQQTQCFEFVLSFAVKKKVIFDCSKGNEWFFRKLDRWDLWAIKTLAVYFPNLNAEQQTWCLEILCARIDDDDEDVRKEILSFFKRSLLYLTAQDKILLAQAIVRLLCSISVIDHHFFQQYFLLTDRSHQKDIVCKFDETWLVLSTNSDDNVQLKMACAQFHPEGHLQYLRQLRKILQQQSPRLTQLQMTHFGGQALRNHIGGFAMIDEKHWAVSLVRGKDKEHVFIILEGIEGGKEALYEIHFREQDGRVVISLEPIHLEKLQHIGKHYCYKGWQISDEKARALLEDIRVDQKKVERGAIEYNYLGNGKIHAFRFKHGHTYHNCVSWAEGQLEGIDLSMERDWLDVVVIHSHRHLPKPPAKKDSPEKEKEKQKPEERNSGRCLTM